MDGQVYSLQSQTVTSTVPTIIDPGLNMLLSETRMTNAELRMGMSKIADNVQKVLDKVHICWKTYIYLSKYYYVSYIVSCSWTSKCYISYKR